MSPLSNTFCRLFPEPNDGPGSGKIGMKHSDSVLLNDTSFMQAALAEARAAAVDGEVPVGCVIVVGNRIVARAGNRTIANCDPTAHAEIVALRAAAKELGNYRLSGAAAYVTVEPCAMCAGAMIQARIARLIYGCDDPKGGAVHTCFDILAHPALNHRVDVLGGVLAEECAEAMQNFFEARR
jgi:tRNA(adenine34) deaminase